MSDPTKPGTAEDEDDLRTLRERNADLELKLTQARYAMVLMEDSNRRLEAELRRMRESWPNSPPASRHAH